MDDKERMYYGIAYNIIDYFQYDKNQLYILVDEAYTEIAESIQKLHKNVEIRVFQSNISEQLQEKFALPHASAVLLLAEPESYVKYRLFRYLDFTEGEPKISDTDSRVLIFPKESTCRMFSGDVRSNITEKHKLLNTMTENQKYRVTSAMGTDLIFESRRWIGLDFEVCTAPIESSINGVIVVDGALFYRKIEETVSFVIKDGKIQSITAESETGKMLVEEYKRMTAGVMQNPVNQQLAEIGIGFLHGAGISDCFMEAETGLNTCHFCFGNNVCYGGENESEFHGASVLIKNPVFSYVD